MAERTLHRWRSLTEKLEIVRESLIPGASAADVAKTNGISLSMLYRWRKAYREGQLGGCRVDGFVPARIVSEVQSTTERAAPAATGTLEVVTANPRRSP
jgi:transposase